MTQAKVIVPNQRRGTPSSIAGAQRQVTGTGASSGSILGTIASAGAASIAADVLKQAFAPELSTLKSFFPNVTGQLANGLRSALGLSQAGTVSGSTGLSTIGSSIGGDVLGTTVATTPLATSMVTSATTVPGLFGGTAAAGSVPMSGAALGSALTGVGLVVGLGMLAKSFQEGPAVIGDIGEAPSSDRLQGIQQIGEVIGQPEKTKITLQDGTTKVIDANFANVQRQTLGGRRFEGAFLDDQDRVILDLNKQVDTGEREAVPNVFGEPNTIAIGTDIMGGGELPEGSRGFASGIGKFTTGIGAGTPNLPEGFVPLPEAPTGNLEAEMTQLSGGEQRDANGLFQAGIPLVNPRRPQGNKTFAELLAEFTNQQEQGAI